MHLGKVLITGRFTIIVDRLPWSCSRRCDCEFEAVLTRVVKQTKEKMRDETNHVVLGRIFSFSGFAALKHLHRLKGISETLAHDCPLLTDLTLYLKRPSMQTFIALANSVFDGLTRLDFSDAKLEPWMTTHILSSYPRLVECCLGV